MALAEWERASRGTHEAATGDGRAPHFKFVGESRCLCGKHPGILAGKREKPEVVANAIFSRFPNENPENAILVKNSVSPDKPINGKIRILTNRIVFI